jgi:phosphatidylserine decarboxylase
MEPITYIDRLTGNRAKEEVYGGNFLELLYGESLFSRYLGKIALPLFAKAHFFSWLYGYFQRLPSSKKKIWPFIKKFQVNSDEFLEGVDAYPSFDAFFTRKLKPEARPIALDPQMAMIPADGRYLFFPRIDESEGFVVKGQKFSLEELLQDAALAKRYEKGSMAMARLCPTDYHRYHFPCRSFAGKTTTINGWLFSVNPIAVKNNIKIFTENKRTKCELASDQFGKIIFMEIGAKCVGKIHQTYTPESLVEKGDEKGFFSFGASSLILLFEPGRILFDNDLLSASKEYIEIRCLMGQSMGRSVI